MYHRSVGRPGQARRRDGEASGDRELWWQAGVQGKRVMPIVMYDLAGADPALRFSPYCWRMRMALAHKGLAVETVPWRFTERTSSRSPARGACR